MTTHEQLAERLVLKFRHSLNVRHEHAVLAAMITVNTTLQFILENCPESPQTFIYENAFKRLEEMMNAHLKSELDKISSDGSAANV